MKSTRSHSRHTRTLRRSCVAVVLAGGILADYHAQAQQLGDVFYIELENHNWTQPAGEGTMTTSGSNAGVTSGSGFAGLFNNPAAPYLNSLIQANTSPVITGNNGLGISVGVSYASAYHSVLSTPTGGPSVHPSEPNYLWQEAGNNFGVLVDNNPYGTGGSVAAIQTYLSTHPTATGQHLTGLLQAAGVPWKSYQEDIDLVPGSGSVNQPGSGSLSSTVAASNQWTVPLTSFSGTSATYTNAYNGSHQYDFATKHDGSLFFEDTNGSSGSANFSTSNPQVSHWSPLQQLATDLTNNTVGKYNLITPNQFNDMHTALGTAFTYAGVTWKAGSDGNRIAVGDNFLSQIIPLIMASAAFQNNGAIVIWTDETEGTNRDDFNHTLAEIVISPLAKGVSVTGGVYNSTLDYTHSQDLATLQEVWGVQANTPTGYLNDAANATQDGTHDLSDMFVAGTIPTTVPEPSAWISAFGGAGLLGMLRRRKTARM